MKVCQNTRDWLYPYLDGEFDTAAQTTFEQHLSQCQSCAVFVERQRANHKAYKAVVSTGDAASARQHMRWQTALKNERRRSSNKRLAIYGVAAACAGFVYFTAHSTLKQMNHAQLAAELISQHERDLPLDVRSERPELVSQFVREQLRSSDAAPRFGASQLIGARILHFNNEPAAYVRLRLSPLGPPAGLFVSARRDADDNTPTSATLRELNHHPIAEWVDENFRYQLVMPSQMKEAESAGAVASMLAPAKSNPRLNQGTETPAYSMEPNLVSYPSGATPAR